MISPVYLEKINRAAKRTGWAPKEITGMLEQSSASTRKARSSALPTDSIPTSLCAISSFISSSSSNNVIAKNAAAPETPSVATPATIVLSPVASTQAYVRTALRDKHRFTERELDTLTEEDVERLQEIVDENEGDDELVAILGNCAKGQVKASEGLNKVSDRLETIRTTAVSVRSAKKARAKDLRRIKTASAMKAKNTAPVDPDHQLNQIAESQQNAQIPAPSQLFVNKEDESDDESL